ncbi:MAG: hypothetical protein LAT58_00950 [Opitutales bacterium]|nr:hypothetical protein [Opitutales bacterium]
MEELEKLVLFAEKAVRQQMPDGSMPAGHNGPYRHRELSIRNTGHWLSTWAHLWKVKGDDKFHKAAIKALGYLLRDDHRPAKANWLQREQKGRDRCNGVIGAAWTGEALWAAYAILGNEEALELAGDVFLKHRFDGKRLLWFRLEVTGESLGIDQTLNHQIWFAATAARLENAGISSLKPLIQTFLDGLSKNFAVEGSGVIRHRIPLFWHDHLFYSGGLPFRFFQYYKYLRTGIKPVNGRQRDVGYHAFNLHALAILHRYYPDHFFWQGSAWKKALAFARSHEHVSEVQVDMNPYAYPYNPVGFEMAFTLARFFPDSQKEQETWIRRQWSALENENSPQYGDCADDPLTAQARLYEMIEWLVESQ